MLAAVFVHPCYQGVGVNVSQYVVFSTNHIPGIGREGYDC
jgi:hypothetical protein